MGRIVGGPGAARRRVGAGVALMALLVGGALPARSAGLEDRSARRLYVVQLAAEPLASFGGGDGLAPTSPKVTGADLDVHSPAATGWRAQLDALEARVLDAAGAADAPVAYRYRTAVAGFAAWLSPAEHARLTGTPGVAAVTLSRKIRRQASRARTAAAVTAPAASPPLSSPSSAAAVVAPAADGNLSGDAPDFLGLPDGLWAQLGGPEHAGDGLVIGVVDDGIVVDHPSFADQPVIDGVANYIGAPFERPADWNGICQTGPRFPACNNKVIGARYFVEGFGAGNVNLDFDDLSPLSVDGHGVEVSAVAAGNYGVDPAIRGNDLGIGIISGIAPRAQLAMYKVAWTVAGDDPGVLWSDMADIVAGVDAAVADGVDVINLSLGDDRLDRTVGALNVTDPFSAATLAAFDAGIVVTVAPPNTGPDRSTAHTVPDARPWNLTVGSSTLSRMFNSTATISDGTGADVLTLTGESLTEGLPATPLVAGSAIPAPGVDAAEADRCLPRTLDPAGAAGHAVFCLREPDDDPLDQADAVVAAGGAAAVVLVAATERGGVNFPIPTIFLHEDAATPITGVLDGAAAPTLALSPAVATASGRGDRVSRFSSRGPAPSRYFMFPGDESSGLLFEGEFIKPDVVAPGEEVFAATVPGDRPYECPGCAPDESFTTDSGTSFAAPTTAGAAALLLDLHPGWSPSAVKSALVTTAATDVTLDDGATPATPLDAGGGRIDPTRAAATGLVLQTSTDDYLRYLDGADGRAVPGTLEPVEATDLNLPSVAFDFLAGSRTTRRTFTSVDQGVARWDVGFEGLSGITPTANPATFAIDPGQSQAVELTFDATTAAEFDFNFGAVVLTNPDDGRTVRLPVSVVPAPTNIVLPQVQANSSSGRVDVTIESAESGTVSAVATGLAAPDVQAGQQIEVGDTPLDPALPGPGLNTHDIEVPPGAQLLQVELGNVDGMDFFHHVSDLELYLLRDEDGNGFRFPDDVVAESAQFQVGFESVGLVDPEPGSYRVLVNRPGEFLQAGPPVATYDLTSWIIADPTPDDLSSPAGPGLAATADPITVAPGGTAALPIDYAGLSVPGTHLGIVTFYDGTPSPRNEIDSRLVVLHYEPEGSSVAVPRPGRGALGQI